MAADLIRSLECKSSGEAALAAGLIRSIKISILWRLHGSRLDQALKILIVQGGCANSHLDQEL